MIERAQRTQPRKPSFNDSPPSPSCFRNTDSKATQFQNTLPCPKVALSLEIVQSLEIAQRQKMMTTPKL